MEKLDVENIDKWRNSRILLGLKCWDFFNDLNGRSLIGPWMPNQSGTNYKKGLENLSSNIYRTIDNTYTDLAQNSSVMQYISSSQRSQMSRCLEDLSAVGKMGSSRSGNKDKCIGILNLSASETKNKSRESSSKIEDGVKTIRRIGSSAEQSLSRVISAGKYSALGATMLWATESAFQGKSINFLQDVYTKLQYDKKGGKNKGHNGKDVCSTEYVKSIREEAFGSKVYRELGERDFKSGIEKSLESIQKQIQSDLNRGKQNNDYILHENAERLQTALNDFKTANISLYNWKNTVSTMDWYVGGDPDKIKRFQNAYNRMNIGTTLVVDGVYGEKTDSAIENYLSVLTSGVAPALKTFTENIKRFNLNNSNVVVTSQFASKTSKALSQTGDILYLLELIEAVDADIADSNTAIERSTVVKISGIIGDFTTSKLCGIALGSLGTKVGITIGASAGGVSGNVPGALVGGVSGGTILGTIGAGIGGYVGSDIGRTYGEMVGGYLYDLELSLDKVLEKLK